MSDTEVRDLLKSAREAIANKQWKEAHQFAKDALVIDKKNYNGLIFYGLASAQLHQTGQSDKAYRKAIEVQPTNCLLARQGLVELFFMVSDWPKLLEESDALLKTVKPDYPKFVDCFHKRAHAFEQLGKRKDSIDCLRALLQVYPKSADPLVSWKLLVELLEADEKDAFKAEVEKRFATKQKKLAIVTQLQTEQMRKAAEDEAKTELPLSEALDAALQSAAQLSPTAEFDNKLLDRALRRMERAKDRTTRNKHRADALKLARAVLAQSKQPATAALELLIDSEEDQFFSKPHVLGRLPALYASSTAAGFGRRLLRIRPDRVLSVVALCVLFSRLNRFDDALSLLEIVLGKASGSLLSRCLHCFLLHSTAQYQTLAEHSKKLIEWLKRREEEREVSFTSLQTELTVLYAIGLRHLAGRQSDADSAFREVLAVEPDSILALQGVAQLAFERKDFIQAQEFYTRLLARQPNDSFVLAELGKVGHLLRADLATAEAHLRKAIEQKADNWHAHLWLGQLLSDKNENAAALSSLLTAARLQADRAQCFTELGLLYLKMGSAERDRARRCLQKALKLDPLDAVAGETLADMYTADGQLLLAAELCKDVCSRSNNQLWAFRRLALHQAANGELESAVESFQSCLRLDPQSAVCWRGLAEAYRRQGKLIAALKAFEKLLQIQADSKYGQYQVGNIRLQLGLRLEAVEMFQSLLSQDRDYVPALRGLGEAQLYYALDRLQLGYSADAVAAADNAIHSLERCTALQSNLCSVWKLLADALVLRSRIGRAQSTGAAAQLAKAKKAYLRAVHLNPHSSDLRHDIAATLHRSGLQQPRKDNGALYWIKTAIAIDVANIRLWNALASIAPAKSLQQHALLTALHLDRKDSQSWARLSVFYLENGDIELAQRCSSMAQHCEPHNPCSWESQALIEEHEANSHPADKEVAERKFKSALSHYKQAVALKPSTDTLLGLGYQAYRAGEFSNAVRALNQLGGSSQQTATELLLALSLERTGQYSAACQLLTSLIHLPNVKEISLPRSVDGQTLLPHAANSSVASMPLEPVARLHLARILLRMNRVEESLAELKQCAADSSGWQFEQQTIVTAVSLSRSGRFKEAAALIDRLLASATNEWKLRLLLLLARIQLHDNNAAGTKAAIGAAAKEFPNLPEVWEAMAAAALCISDHSTAVAAAERLWQLRRDKRSAILAAVVAPQQQIKATLRALHMYPDSNRIRARLAALVHDSPNARLSEVRSAARSIALSTNSDLYLATQLLLTAGKSASSSEAAAKRAVSLSRRAIHCFPASAVARLLHALACYVFARRVNTQKEWRSCALTAEQYLKNTQAAVKPEVALNVRLAAAEAQMRLQKGDALLKELESELQGKDQLLSMLMECYMIRARLVPNSSIQLHKQALQLDESSARVLASLANEYLQREQYEPAELCLQQILNTTQSPATTYATNIRLAHLYYATKRFDQSAKILKRMADTQPTDSTVQLLSALLSYKQSRLDDCEWYAAAALSADSLIPFANLLLSHIHLKRNAIAAAESDCLYERDNNALNEQLHFQLYKIASAAAQWDVARSHLSKAIRLNPSRTDYWAELPKLKKLSLPAPAAKAAPPAASKPPVSKK